MMLLKYKLKCATFIAGFILLAVARPSVHATITIEPICPGMAIQPRGPVFEPGGIILTAFDRRNLWAYNIDRSTRFPLEGIAPCIDNCHLSFDARWITTLDTRTGGYQRMRLDGAHRTVLVNDASEIQWWDDDTLLIWTPDQRAYLQHEGGAIELLPNPRGIVSIQPGGYQALRLAFDGENFIRMLVDLLDENGGTIPLGIDLSNFNAASWSPRGEWLAYVAPVDHNGNTSGELFGIRTGESTPIQWTNFTQNGGAVRINGLARRDLSWSPDGTRLAFWILPLDNPETARATIHILDINTGAIYHYCDYTTAQHTPNTPRLVWSPDSSHLAFSGEIPGSTRGYLLLTLDTISGIFTELSSGVFPALGRPDVIAWGLR